MIPYGGTYEMWGAHVSLCVADLDYGVLYVFAIGSIATYGSMLAGWAGNNNFGMLGSIRVSAQMISYEVAMGITVVGLFMIFGTLKLTDMGVMQQETFRLFGFLEHFGWVAPGNALDRLDHDPDVGHRPAAAAVLHVPDRAHGREQARAVRHARGRVRDRGRLLHRVLAA